MIKKIKVEQLKPGMFIHDFNCGWLQHPFFSNSIKIKKEKTINKIIDNGIREVYIDTGRGPDVIDAPTEDEVKRDIRSEIDKVACAERTPESEPNPKFAPKKVLLQEELARAKSIEKEAKNTVLNIMDDVRFGKQIETEKIKPVVAKMVGSILRNEDAFISLSRIRTADEYTYEHSMSVCILMIAFGRQLGITPPLLNEIGIGAMLHDIGKMKVPRILLNKPGRLSEDEYIIIKEHVVHSREILEQTPNISETSKNIAAQHHERYDGTGYPEGLKDDEISPYGQMAAIVDVYDAITSDRCYRSGTLPTDALGKLFEWSKFHFNQNLVEHFIRCVGIYPVGSLVRLESGLLGVVINHGEESLLQPVIRVIYDLNKEQFISPMDIDPSLPKNQSGAYRVLSSEPPEKWNIKPEIYLPQKQMPQPPG